jgi:hypothetical protein
VRRAFCLLSIATLLTSERVYAQENARDAGPSREDIPSLVVGKQVEREIKAGEVHFYRINVNSGDFVRGTVEQRGITINVRGSFQTARKSAHLEDRQPAPGTSDSSRKLPVTADWN